MKRLKGDIQDTFSFEARDVKSYMTYDLRLNSKLSDSFDYVSKNLKANKIKDLNKIKWYEMKNYDWCFLVQDNIGIVIRQYGNHFTFYVKLKGESKYDSSNSVFTFYSDRERMTGEDNDKYVNDPYIDVNAAMPNILKLAKEESLGMVWNSYSLPVPKHVKVKSILDRSEIDDVDGMIFACEELFRLHFEMFCHNEMPAAIQRFKKGDFFCKAYNGDTVVEEVCLHNAKESHEYHNIGLQLKLADGKEEFKDVYTLARYYYENIFPKEQNEE